MRIQIVLGVALISLSGLGLLLLFADRREPSRSARAGPPRRIASVESSEPESVIPMRVETVRKHFAEKSLPVESLETFQQRIGKLAARQNEDVFLELLRGWRSGTYPSEKERILEEALMEHRSEDLTTAAGELLLEDPPHEEQVDGLCAILAADGSPSAVAYLLEAAREHPRVRSPALSHFATVSNAAVTESLCRWIPVTWDLELRQAMGRALEGIGTEEAEAFMTAHPEWAPLRSP